MFNNVFNNVYDRLNYNNEKFSIDGSKLILEAEINSDCQIEHRISITKPCVTYGENVYNIRIEHNCSPPYIFSVNRNRVAELSTFFKTILDYIDSGMGE